jgi:hypothetical protein
VTFSNPPSFLPPVLATGQSASSNGRQQLGSGLVTHRGIIDANSFRAQGNLYPQSGAGLEAIYSGGPAGFGVLQVYNRDTSQYLDLNLAARNITLGTNAGGKVTLPAGTAQALLGQYFTAPTYTTPSAAAWYETPVQVSFTSTGFALRVEYGCSVRNSVAGAVTYVGIGLDGGISWAMNLITTPAVNYITPASGVVYTTPTAGSHRVSVFLYCNTGLTSIEGGANCSLWVTEQRS